MQNKKRVGFKVGSGPTARQGMPILKDGAEVGQVTSGTYSPVLKQGVGMGFVSTAFSKAGNVLEVSARGKPLAIEVCKTPFVPARYVK